MILTCLVSRRVESIHTLIRSNDITLDFENGAGPLAMINPKLDKLLI